MAQLWMILVCLWSISFATFAFARFSSKSKPESYPDLFTPALKEAAHEKLEEAKLELDKGSFPEVCFLLCCFFRL